MPERLADSPETITTEEYGKTLQELQSVINTSTNIEYGVYDCSYGPDGRYYLINNKSVVAGPDFTVSEKGKMIGSRQIEFIDSGTGAIIRLLKKEKPLAELEIDASVYVSDLFKGDIPNLLILFYYRSSQILSRHVLYADNETDKLKWQPRQLITAIAEQNRKQLG